MTPITRITKNGRVCCGCKKWKCWSKFNKRIGGLNGYRSRCRNCGQHRRITIDTIVTTASTRITKTGRVCCGCKKWKQWDKFNKATGGFNGHRSRCSSCDGAVSAKWKETSNYYQNNREEILKYKRESYCPIAKKNYDLQKKYGITLDDFMEMFEDQNGKCKICSRDVKKFSTSKSKQDAAVVDHDHTTGLVRGLLCHSCNRAIGLFNDEYAILLKAAEYIKQ